MTSDFSQSKQSTLSKPAHLRTIAAIPCFNTTHSIAGVVLQTRKYVDKVIVIDDGSVDNTAEIAMTAGASVISHGRNLGKGAAMKTAVANADAEVIVFIDGDGQHDPRNIPELVQPIMEGKADFVIGSRYLQGSRALAPPFMRKLTNYIASVIISFVISVPLPVAGQVNRLVLSLKSRSHSPVRNRTINNSRDERKAYKRANNYRLITGTMKWITDCTSGFRAVRKDSWQSLNLVSNGFQIETEMIYEFAKGGFAIAETPVTCKWGDSVSKLSIIRDGARTVILLANKLCNWQ